MESGLKNVTINEVTENSQPKFVKTEAVVYQREGDEPKIWEMIKSHDSVHILVDNIETRELLFVKQVRIPVLVNTGEGACIECAAGLVDKETSVMQIAKEEVIEELGYEPKDKNLLFLRSYKSSVGTAGTNCSAFICTVVEADKVSEGGGLESEDIEIVRVPYDDVQNFLDEQINIDATTLYLTTFWLMSKDSKAARKPVKVWCEWDMGFSNIDDYNSVFDSNNEALAALYAADWKMVGYNTWQEVYDDGLLTIEEV